MRVLVTGENDALAAEVAAILAIDGMGCRAVEVAPLAAVVGSDALARAEVALLLLPADVERGAHAVRALRAASPATILAIGATDDAKRVLRVLREGADEYLDQGDLQTELRLSLSRLKTKKATNTHSGRVIGLLAAGGGSGASTLAANLAVLLAKWHGQIALVELRPAPADQAVLLDLNPPHSLADLCRNVSRLDATMFQQSLAVHPSGVHLLAAPATFEDAGQVTAQGVREVLNVARALYPYVLLDIDRALRAEQLAAVMQADLLLLVLRLDMASLRNAQRVLAYLKHLGIPETKVLGVVNRYKQKRELPAGKVEQILGIDLAHRIPDDPARMNLAANRGVPVVLERPRARVSRALLRLAQDLKDRHELHRRNGHGEAVLGSARGRGFWSLVKGG